MRHGTRWTYDRYHCRCDLCRAARRAYDAKRPDRSARRSPDVDEIAVERACKGDRTVRLNGAEMAAAYAWLDSHGYSLRRIAAVLGVSDRAVSRWRAGEVGMPHSRPGEVA